MPTSSSSHEEPAQANPPRPCVARERMLLGLMMFALARSGTARCEDEFTFTTPPPGLPGMSLPKTFEPDAAPLPAGVVAPYVQDAYAAPPLPDDPGYSGKEFRPRGASVYASAEHDAGSAEPPLMRSTTVWQRLSEYRARDRVRVLTLWESGAGTVSLQAGKRGDPSLQWTSRLMNRGGATRGVLDRLFAVSIAGASSGLRAGARTASAPRPGIKPLRMEAAGK